MKTVDSPTRHWLGVANLVGLGLGLVGVGEQLVNIEGLNVVGGEYVHENCPNET
jgi:hypothetical protein